MRSAAVGNSVNPRSCACALGALRVVDGLVAGDLHWASPLSEGTEIGALALGPDGVTDVGPGVSGHHVRLFCGDDGIWRVRDLGSREGSVLVSGSDRSEIVIGEGSSRGGSAKEGEAFEVHAGDELVLAGNMRFMLIEGVSEG